MERDGTNDFLLESIRKELVSIIEEGDSNVKENNISIRKGIPESTCGRKSNADRSNSISTTNSNSLESHGELSPSYEIVHQREYSSTAIDEDFQRMNLNLKNSYELFQSIGGHLENINFCSLKSRIKDLNLNDKTNESLKQIAKDLKNTFDQKFIDNRVNDLTKEVGIKFRKHPGEFGDIPELSEFFRACTQLQHGLETLKRHRNEIQDITRRVTHVVEKSCDRSKEIQKNREISHQK
ncbi:uncharacterized protein LOC142221383 [Haematobia irritans]|uniref:uncharacterized protein LOC142221383 n=1 Tax=Haematobia irritans TaxID=7368 RepID=UPI003F50C862